MAVCYANCKVVYNSQILNLPANSAPVLHTLHKLANATLATKLITKVKNINLSKVFLIGVFFFVITQIPKINQASKTIPKSD